MKELYAHKKRYGIFVDFPGDGLRVLDLGENPRRTFRQAGLLLATSRGYRPPSPIWLITGTDPEHTRHAANLLINAPERISCMAGAVLSNSDVYPVPFMDEANEQ